MSSHATDPSLAVVPAYLEEPGDTPAPADVPTTGLLRFARMAGSSIAGRDAAVWVTDFLNAAYYRRPAADRDVDDPACRMELARLGPPTPERAAPAEQVWHTYPPVRMPSAEAVIAALTAPETWPDYASEIGRFTPLRPLHGRRTQSPGALRAGRRRLGAGGRDLGSDAV